eukprot:TRINITY_DN16874_c0_g1_i1.p1 TRINITY_DN16874_c0_g1~~TRINITY_DN16874_c0_g1_i1.p1  ORF type:complete len:142 (+),score=21.42 TRINITY_DN16874_c0_g1_i1:91-516(+)
MLAVKKCEICNEASSKYKCPVCRIPYCSLFCYRQHKATPCNQTELPPSNSQSDSNVKIAALRGSHEASNNDEEGRKLTKQQLEVLASSDSVRNMLRDEQLQRCIRLVDSSENPEKALDTAMGAPAFKEFTDKVLAALQRRD